MKRNGMLVLLVDDDADVLGIEALALTRAGYLVISATRATYALRFFGSVKIDLVLTDVRMPGMDGVEFARQIKAISPATAVICASGFGSAVAEGRNAPCDDFIVKPIMPSMLTKRVGALLHV
jgi:DNA-binding response OmpR family regulator